MARPGCAHLWPVALERTGGTKVLFTGRHRSPMLGRVAQVSDLPRCSPDRGRAFFLRRQSSACRDAGLYPEPVARTPAAGDEPPDHERSPSRCRRAVRTCRGCEVLRAVLSSLPADTAGGPSSPRFVGRRPGSRCFPRRGSDRRPGADFTLPALVPGDSRSRSAAGRPFPGSGVADDLRNRPRPSHRLGRRTGQ